ncbi:ATP-binding protein [Marinoscillum pacificum]|uniref:ATP-binding protein n=1 Tax=Marinoscillum pacificum TaxID=392723 RepID=UPI002158444B|nr:ATP-binding protein [Marinoscillum pacificum]
MKLRVTFVELIISYLKRKNIANFIGFLLILLTISVTGIGYITYSNLSEIVSDLQTDSRPDDNLILYKEIMISISDMENKIESYQLTGNTNYLQQYDQSVIAVFKTLDSLNKRNRNDKELIALNDSLGNLVIRKNDLLEDILQLSQTEVETNLDPLQSHIEDLSHIKIPDSLKEQKDTITQTELIAQKEKEGGLFNKIFKRKPAPPSSKTTTIIQDKEVNTDSIYLAQASTYQDKLREAITQIQQSNQAKSQQLKQRELLLQNKHDDIQQTIMDLISRLESRETVKMKINSLEARNLASKTNQQILIFSSLTFLLLLATIIIIFSYVQKNKKYQQLLKRSKESTETLSKAKERFFANMSHEIRTPMNAISGFSKLLLRSELNSDQQEQVEIIKKSSDHLLKLLNDILDFSKLQALKLQLEKKSFNLQELLDDTYKLLKEPADSKGLHLFTTYSDLPKYVSGDPYRLKQILINLLNNSIKYTESGSVELKVTATNLDEKSAIEIQVIDTGRGIPKESQFRLFQEFEQSDQSSFSKGTGLGLAITKKLVQLHQGKINLESEEGEGTTVTVNLEYEIAAEPPREKEVFEYDDNFSDKKFLIADDEPFNIKLLATLLDKCHAKYDTAVNGAEAFELLQKNKYDVVLLDLKMPEMTGWEVAKAVRETDNPNVDQPLIALTATVAQIDKQKAQSSGFDHILRKPFDEAELFTLISKSAPGNRSIKITQPIKKASMTQIDLSSLQKMGDDAFVTDMVETFIESANKEWTIIELALEAHDLDTVANSAHKIVAPARHLKAEKLVPLLKNIEKTADSGSSPSEKLLEDAQNELDQVILALNQYLEKDHSLK